MISLNSNSLIFQFPEIHSDAKCSINFQRTLRIPDDGKKYELPPGLGKFPIQHVDDFASVLPEEWLIRGGVIIPMHNSEALWIDFRSNGYPFAIKIGTGKINAITGEKFKRHLNSDPQDYLIIPDQPWIDGYNVDKGVIRQFVAMPLGEGYSAEEQITGSGEYGGIQISVCPMKVNRYKALQKKRHTKRRKMRNDNINNLLKEMNKAIRNIVETTTHSAEGITTELDKFARELCSKDDLSGISQRLKSILDYFRNDLQSSINSDFQRIEGIINEFRDTVIERSSLPCASKVSQMPSIGLSPGGKMHQEIYTDKYGLDAWDQRNISRCFVAITNSYVWKAITKMDPPTKPFTAQDYNKKKLPWFDYYDSHLEAVEEASILKELKSIIEMSKSKGDIPIADNETLNEENVITLTKKETRLVRENFLPVVD